MRFSIVASLLSVAALVHGYANPMSCSGVCNNAHDPALIRRDDGTYFRFSTGGKIAIHSAPSITGPWTYRGAAIPKGSTINLTGKDDLWVCWDFDWLWLEHELNAQKKGSRCHQGCRYLLPLLQRLVVWLPELCHWCSN